ncbi:triose-phosphate isomerase [Bauldia sp.]|uniref:triose-phosphate isomerase n=1 Tax=Bauldia sp. TaxID=2575872 RepID=UPI003BAAE593
MPDRRPLVAGNWKMNGVAASLTEIDAIGDGLIDPPCDVAICPPATLIAAAVERAKNTPLMIGGQDCHMAEKGAHTGDLSAEMIADAGGKLVIVGHSERRTDHGEADALVRAKAEAGWRAGLLVILCIGETEAERRAGDTLAVLDRQLAGSLPDGADAHRLVIAYEPVWAIGTGLTPSNDDIQTAHAHIRQRLVATVGNNGAAIRVLYGGSVKPGNADEILPLPDVDGALVGGASLKAADFLAIVAAA